MPDLHQHKEGNVDAHSRHLTIGLGSALDAFAEADEVDKLIVDLGALCKERYRERLTEILDQYQEQPHLLDPHLPGYLSRLIEAILRMYTEKFSDGNKSNLVEPSIINEAHSAAFCAQQLIKANKRLGQNIKIRQQKNSEYIFNNIIKQQDHFTLTMCNFGYFGVILGACSAILIHFGTVLSQLGAPGAPWDRQGLL